MTPCINKTFDSLLHCSCLCAAVSPLCAILQLAHSTLSTISNGSLPCHYVPSANLLLIYSCFPSSFLFRSFSFSFISFFCSLLSIFAYHGTRLHCSSRFECFVRSKPCITSSLCRSNRNNGFFLHFNNCRLHEKQFLNWFMSSNGVPAKKIANLMTSKASA